MTNSKIKTKADAEHRLMAIAFEFQDVLLALVHGTRPGFERYTPKEAEGLADEIQSLHHYFEVQGQPYDQQTTH